MYVHTFSVITSVKYEYTHSRKLNNKTDPCHIEILNTVLSVISFRSTTFQREAKINIFVMAGIPLLYNFMYSCISKYVYFHICILDNDLVNFLT